MSVGQHMRMSDWNARAYQLWQTHQAFVSQAAELAGYLAPLTDQQVMDATGFSAQDVVDLKSGVNVAKALADLSSVNGTPLTAQAQTASQATAALAKFGGA